ncbi:hypothetical protein VP193E371_P0156 [Vibrio phage 193E37-1]|nr:hypothetical protein VP193E371_P0156 [Vibrio phage 193E37-1]
MRDNGEGMFWGGIYVSKLLNKHLSRSTRTTLNFTTTL